MSYNAQLQENNADLQEILDKVNALPDAGADPVYQDKTVTPIKNGLVVLPDDGYDALGKVFISGDGDLVPENIKAGVEIFGVTGSMEAGIDTSDATATAEQMAEGVTAYVNGEKVTGTAKTVRGSYSKTVTPSFTSAAGGAIKLIQMMDTIAEPTFFGTTGATGLTLQAQASEFGDAEPSDVTKGKTFTSAAGLKAVGTKEESGGGTSNVQTCTVKLDNESVSDDCDILAIVATVFEDGIFKTHAAFASDLLRGEGFGTSVTLHNVVCNTKIYLIAYIANYSKVGAYVEIDGSATLESDASIIEVYDQALLTFTAPSASGEECTIYYSYNV